MFPKAVKVFSFFGFDIKIDPSWLLIAALITWALSTSYFPKDIPGLSYAEYMFMGLVAMALFFVSLVLHEFGHAIIAHLHNVKVSAITLFVFGGVAELESEPRSAKSEFWIAVAGPVVSLVLSLGFWIAKEVVELIFVAPIVASVIGYLALINLVLAIFNLLPAFPLDGGRILRAAFWSRTNDLLLASRVASQSGKVLATLLIALGILALFQGVVVGGIWQIMIGMFLYVAAQSSYQNQLVIYAFGGQTIKNVMTPNPTVVGPELSLDALAKDVMVRKRVSFLPVVENGELIGLIDNTVLAKIDPENWAATHVGDVFIAVDAQNTVPQKLDIREFLTRIGRQPRRKFLVTDNGNLVGVITFADIFQQFSLLQSLCFPMNKFERNQAQ